MTKRVWIAVLCALPGLSWAAEAEPPTGARVEVTSPDGEVGVAVVTSREAVHVDRGSMALRDPGSNTTSTGTMSSTLYPVGYRDICIAPCSFEAPAGPLELLVYKPGMVDASRVLDLGAGQRLAVDADLVRDGPKKAARTLWSVGGAALLAGVAAHSLALTDGGEQAGAALAIGGATAMAVGIPLDLLHRSRIEVRQ